ncbi:MAG: glycosyltransferase family 9 protein [Prevotellaceae bacterium]|nr:glycosyltransferase family 9 protein [Prevotellaceae bacterium]
MKTEHLLIIRFSSLGDIAMTVPVVKALATQYPELRITVLSRPLAKDLFGALPPNVNFMGADIKNEYKHITGLNELYKRLIAKHFTMVADFHGVLRTEFLRGRFNLDRIKTAHINKHRKGRKKLCRLKNKVLVQQPSPFQNYAEVLNELGYPISLDQSMIPYNYDNSDLQKSADERWIGVAPVAAYEGKTYPLDKMAKAISIISNKYANSRFFVFGVKNNDFFTLSNNITDNNVHLTNVKDIAKGFAEELKIMSALNVMISMDSANMHLASLVGTPVVSIWGQTHPYAGFMGWGQSTENAVQLDMPCRPCSAFGSKKCAFDDYPCLNNITPEQIAEKVIKNDNSDY